MQGNNHEIQLQASISSSNLSLPKHDCIRLQVMSSVSGEDTDFIITAKKSVLEDAIPEVTEALNDDITMGKMSNGFVFGFSLKEHYGLTSMDVIERLMDYGFRVSSSATKRENSGDLLHVYLMARTSVQE